MGKKYEAVIQPNHLETVITTLKTGENQSEEKWKLTRYYDNPKFWSKPGVEDQVTTILSTTPLPDNSKVTVNVTTTKTKPVPEQYELYNLTQDPYEEKNLAHPINETSETKHIQQMLLEALENEKQKKRLSPANGSEGRNARQSY